MTHTTTEFCPTSTRRPRAVVDAEGFCQEHGWDCDDFSEFTNSEDDTDESGSGSADTDEKGEQP